MLSPDRCTRSEGGEPHIDPVRDRDHLIPGDELLVDVRAYVSPSPGIDGWPLVWCMVKALAAGSASVYPYKVKLPHGGPGQFKATEVLGWRRPVWLHDAVNDMVARNAE